jgi:hypothetical protein
LEKYRGSQDCIEKVREHRELLSETTELENEIWLLKPQKVARALVSIQKRFEAINQLPDTIFLFVSEFGHIKYITRI